MVRQQIPEKVRGAHTNNNDNVSRLAVKQTPTAYQRGADTRRGLVNIYTEHDRNLANSGVEHCMWF
jgi:hypothetical protein